MSSSENRLARVRELLATVSSHRDDLEDQLAVLRANYATSLVAVVLLLILNLGLATYFWTLA
jgi:hypothetical protein